MVDEPLRASVARVKRTSAQAYEPDDWYKGPKAGLANMSNKPDIFADPDAWESDLVRRLSGAMAAGADRAQAVAEGRAQDAIGDTESEIFWDSFPDSRAAPHAYVNNSDGDDIIAEMSQMEGLDGEPLSDAGIDGVDYAGRRCR